MGEKCAYSDLNKNLPVLVNFLMHRMERNCKNTKENKPNSRKQSETDVSTQYLEFNSATFMPLARAALFFFFFFNDELLIFNSYNFTSSICSLLNTSQSD